MKKSIPAGINFTRLISRALEYNIISFRRAHFIDVNPALIKLANWSYRNFSTVVPSIRLNPQQYNHSSLLYMYTCESLDRAAIFKHISTWQRLYIIAMILLKTAN